MSIRKSARLSILSALLVAFALSFSLFTFSSSAHAATAQANKAAACPVTLRQGSNGPTVKTLQFSLNGLYENFGDPRYFYNSPKDFGPYTQDPWNPLRVDGDFGGHTFNAVWDYQYWNGLKIDGVVGPETWHSLGYC